MRSILLPVVQWPGVTGRPETCQFPFEGGSKTIEKNYGMVSTLFKICTVVDKNKLAKEKPYALEQLRVCHLLLNCYVCLNKDQASFTNTFGCNPPLLKDYLKL